MSQHIKSIIVAVIVGVISVFVTNKFMSPQQTQPAQKQETAFERVMRTNTFAADIMCFRHS